MTIGLNLSKKLDLRKHLIYKINYLIITYKDKYDIETIHFKQPIDGIKYVGRLYLHYGNDKIQTDMNQLESKTLMKLYQVLKEKEFYGMCKTTTGDYVKITPKKN